MKIDQLQHLLEENNFKRTNQPLSYPIVIHGVPGCGKSTIIRQLLTIQGFSARTCGPAYGSTLASEGVLPHSCGAPPTIARILDEYQLASPHDLQSYNVLFGDPYQGPNRLVPHYLKTTSHRVPSIVCAFLRSRDYTIESAVEGSLTTRPPYHPEPIAASLFLHLGPVSSELTHSHGVCSKSPTQVQGQEADRVCLVYHSSETADRASFYVGATRAKSDLILVSDEFHELQTSN